MKKFWQGITNGHPLILFVCMVLLIFIYVNFNYATDIGNLEVQKAATDVQVNKIKTTSFEYALDEEIRSNDAKLKLVVDYMVDKIQESYEGKLNTFANDFKNPTSDAELYEILNEGIVRLNLQEDPDSKYIITSRYNILSKYKTTTSEGKTDEESEQLLSYVSKNYKKMMDHDVSNLIVDIKDQSKLYTTADIANLYMADKQLDNFYLLIPTYITSDGDIFGTPDFDSLGRPVNNFRLMAIKVVQLDKITKNLYNLDKEINTLSKQIIEQQDAARFQELQRRVFSSLLLFMAALGILLFVQYEKVRKTILIEDTAEK